jgi:hypothetical protein
MARLTEELVLSRTRAKSLAEVRNLNMWGNELKDVSSLHLYSSNLHFRGASSLLKHLLLTDFPSASNPSSKCNSCRGHDVLRQ